MGFLLFEVKKSNLILLLSDFLIFFKIGHRPPKIIENFKKGGKIRLTLDSSESSWQVLTFYEFRVALQNFF